MKILLALHPSIVSQALVRDIASRPWPPDSSFEVVSIIEPSHLWTTSEAAHETARCAEKTVCNAVACLESGGYRATGITPSGDPKRVILDRAKRLNADFIALGSNLHSALSKFVLGSVAATVLRYAPCSVNILRPGPANRARASKKILLGTDGSEFSHWAAKSVADRPWPKGSEVRLLSAVQLLLPNTRAFFEPPFIDSDYIESARAEAMQRAQDAIARETTTLSPTGLDVSESISVLLDPPQTVILDEATRWGADVIVVGSHGYHGLDRFLLGSVSEAIAMHAHCSVEVIRKKV